MYFPESVKKPVDNLIKELKTYYPDLVFDAEKCMMFLYIKLLELGVEIK